MSDSIYCNEYIYIYISLIYATFCDCQLHNVTLALEMLSDRDIEVDDVDPQGETSTSSI